jgi:colicin import membrane protein
MGDAWPVAKKLKVFRTSMGFFELAIAAPSMKAAAEAWGTDPDIFRRGFAEQTEDRKIVEAAMAAPGVVLRRPVGSDGAFSEKAALPDAPAGAGKKQYAPRPDKMESKSRPDPAEKGKREEAAARQRDETAAREKEAAAAREEEEKRQELERRKKAAEEERARKQREQKIARANAAFERAKGRHDQAVQSLAKRRKELDDDEFREDERWEREQREHREALREAQS